MVEVVAGILDGFSLAINQQIIIIMLDKRLELTTGQNEALKELGKAIEKCSDLGLLFIIGDDEGRDGQGIRCLNTKDCHLVCDYPYGDKEDGEFYSFRVSKLKRVQSNAIGWYFFQKERACGRIAVLFND